MDVIMILGVLFAFMMVFISLIAMLLVFVYQRELDILPRKYFAVDIYALDKGSGKEELQKSYKGWVIKRKQVQFLRLGFGGLNGVDLDVGFTRHAEKKEKRIVIELIQKIPGVWVSTNFIPRKLPFEVQADLERHVKQKTILLEEAATRLCSTNTKEATPEVINSLKEAIMNLKTDINADLDRIIDYDRRIDCARVSGWNEFEASGIEKASYKIKKDDWLEKYLSYMGIFAAMITVLISIIFISQMFENTAKNSTAQITGSCNNANAMFVIAAQSCGWAPAAPSNNTVIQNVPAGIPNIFG
jgi:hypothetical protein